MVWDAVVFEKSLLKHQNTLYLQRSKSQHFLWFVEGCRHTTIHVYAHIPTTVSIDIMKTTVHLHIEAWSVVTHSIDL